MGQETRTKEEYEQAKKIIEILIKNGLITRDGDMDSYLATYDSSFEIIDLFK